MTASITLWLAFVLAAGLIAFASPNKWQAVCFALVAIITAPFTVLPLGHATPLPLPAHATVLGADIRPGKAIYVLLAGEDEPRLYVIPYSQGKADQLQQAMDGTADGEGTVSMTMGEDGSPGFAEETPPPEAEKRQERAVIGG